MLRWRGLSLSYSSVLRQRPRERVAIETALQEFSAPQVAGSSLHWSSSRLKFTGTWGAHIQPIKRTLLESADGSIEWNCWQPRARAEVRFGAGQSLEGLGYAEHLTMTIPPWRLPFTELRWGRFLSGEDALVWINWRGDQSLNLSFHNGRCIDNARLTDQEYRTGEVVLALSDQTVLREGPLVETALSAIPGIHKLFPFRILRTHECKWLSRGSMRKPDGGKSFGWVIHEVVRWPAKNS